MVFNMFDMVDGDEADVITVRGCSLGSTATGYSAAARCPSSTPPVNSVNPQLHSDPAPRTHR